MLKWRKLSRSTCALPLHGAPVWLRVRLVQVSPGGLLILAMLRVHRLHASIVAGVAILLDFAQGTKLFLFAFVTMICRMNVNLYLDTRCVLFYSGIVLLGHFRYQFGRSGMGFLNNTRYSVCDGVPGSA